MKMLRLCITHKSNLEDLGLGTHSMTFCSEDTTIKFSGKNVAWLLELKKIESLTVEKIDREMVIYDERN